MLTGHSDELSRLNQTILCNSAWHLHGICMAFAWHLLQVIKPHSWGTHMLIVEGMKAYWTAAGLGRPGTAWDPGTWDGPWKMPTASQDGNLATSKRCGTTKRALEGGAWVMIGMVWNGMEWYGISDLNALDICCSCSH